MIVKLGTESSQIQISHRNQHMWIYLLGVAAGIAAAAAVCAAVALVGTALV